jgi:hypothetical protein
MGSPTLKSTQGIAATALIGPRTTIIVVFLVRAGRLSEVIMDDHRPHSTRLTPKHSLIAMCYALD